MIFEAFFEYYLYAEWHQIPGGAENCAYWGYLLVLMSNRSYCIVIKNLLVRIRTI
jgi:hypothetical protein